MRTTTLSLVLIGFAASALKGQSPGPDSTHVDTTFVGIKDISPPQLIRCPQLPHTTIRGTVQISMTVDTLGHPESGSVKVKSSDDDSLKVMALRLAPECRFKPGRYRRHAIRVPVTLPFSF